MWKTNVADLIVDKASTFMALALEEGNRPLFTAILDQLISPSSADEFLDKVNLALSSVNKALPDQQVDDHVSQCVAYSLKRSDVVKRASQQSLYQ